ncbi:hypothetical protein N7540_010129 [Penicillium herquei]|nr:hypothetical protein N7540_010129 [Penicillium herquei]
MEYSSTQLTGQTKAMTTWDLTEMVHLRLALQQWVAMGVSACHIGEYLVMVLYNRDYHIENRVTWMARANFPFATIGLDILQYLQIRGEAGSPFWIPGHVILGDVLDCPRGPATYSPTASEIATPPADGADDSEPVFLTSAVYVPPKEDKTNSPVDQNGSEPVFLTSAVYVPPKEDTPREPVPAPKPVRPFEKPSFLAASDAHYQTKELPFRTEAGIKAYIEQLKNPKPTIEERRAERRARMAIMRVSAADTI